MPYGLAFFFSPGFCGLVISRASITNISGVNDVPVPLGIEGTRWLRSTRRRWFLFDALQVGLDVCRAEPARSAAAAFSDFVFVKYRFMIL